MIKAFLSALSFLTRIPAPSSQLSSKDWQKSVIFYPLVGLLIGMIIALGSVLLVEVFPLTITAFFLLVLWVWITGGLHLDGWMDLADGLGSNRSREQMLEIMKDSRVGAMGVIAAILLMIGKGMAIYELLSMNLTFLLIFSPLFARFVLIFSIKAFPYKKEGGLGEGLHRYLSIPVIVLNLAFVLAITFFLLSFHGLILIILSVIVSTIFVLYVFKKLGMLTGDCYGAIIEWSECVSLFLAIAIWRLF
ncbi:MULTISPECIES: adenosylcobinamide-GDP ribazoletransferase [Bacillaceae]|uniref:adenosylcobinamide-GDP ribazoletransferase n=1 Tax=Bacillaceae TaxID=186817 RepID=UPI001E54F5BF|nr:MULTISPECIES: adenosylcobinamide-GDP ribazoletransferase [Bacillaceae]UGB33005.1 adenosylcobinamide-GDP ribazoletransferase [Metabacillus sp. B2-18]